MEGATMFDKIKDLLGGGSSGDLGDLSLGGFEKYLEGVDFPIGVDDLMAVFQQNGAPPQLQSALQGVSAGGKHSFSSKEDVVDSLKGQLGNVI
jgi:hypothetical protein